MLRSSIIGLLGALALTEPVSAAPKTTTPGSTVGELIALARQLSPELAAAALNAEAAVARSTSAGALPDPTGRVTTDNLDQRNVSMNGRTTQYRLMQEFPLWGKLDLKRDIASFEATAAQHRRRSAELELVARVKGVFAARYATFKALTLTQQTLDTVTTATANVRDRYSQGSAAQDGVLRLRDRGRRVEHRDRAVARPDDQDGRTAQCAPQSSPRCTAGSTGGATSPPK